MTVVYLVGSDTKQALHALNGQNDRLVQDSMPALPGVGCESQFCSGTDLWSVSLAYAPDAKAISLVVSVANVEVFRVWTAEGKVLDNSDSRGRSMPVWSGSSLYFRDAGGVEVWRGGAVSSFLPGVAWISPQASPAGGQLVYATKDAQGSHHVFVANTATGAAREIQKSRSRPVFLTSRYLWYRGERACVASDNCPGGWSVVDNGHAYIYDLQIGTEYDSIITNVYDAWPHAA